MTRTPKWFASNDLTSMADVYSVRTKSMGWKFVFSVQDHALDMWNDAPANDRNVDALSNDGRLRNAANAAMPSDFADMWQTFVDLGAYHEDPTIRGADSRDMEQAARACLYIIADRLVRALVGAWARAAAEAGQ